MRINRIASAAFDSFLNGSDSFVSLFFYSAMKKAGENPSFDREWSGVFMKFKIHPFALLLIIFFAFFCREIPLICLVFSACTHEICHLCFFTLFGAKVRQVEVLPFGISASFDGVAALGYRQEMVCVLAGPFCNLILAGFFSLIGRFSPFSVLLGLENFVWCNLALGVVNLLPIYPLDGGRWLFCLLKSRIRFSAAERAVKIVSFSFLAPLFAVGSAAALGCSHNFSLIFIFAYLVCYLLLNGVL